MEYKAWEFENNWYVSTGGLPLCMNTEAACIQFAEAIAKLEYLEDAIHLLGSQVRHNRPPKRVPDNKV